MGVQARLCDRQSPKVAVTENTQTITPRSDFAKSWFCRLSWDYFPGWAKL